MHHLTGCPLTVYKAIVVGAGPSGLACIGNILDRLRETGEEGEGRVLWIDPVFEAGRLSAYPEVPSNTKVCLFTKFALECKSFGKAEQTIEPSSSKTTTSTHSYFHRLVNELDPQRGCKLGLAAGLCRELTEHLMTAMAPLLHYRKSSVREMKFSVESNCWQVTAHDGVTFNTQKVFLTTGSRPKTMKECSNSTTTSSLIALDDALNPGTLNSLIESKDIVALYGSSHSAMLVLMNLLNCSRKPRLIINYYRQPPKFASFPDPATHPDRILHDNTGLKGEVADWVRKWHNLQGKEFDEFFDNRLQRIKCSDTINNGGINNNTNNNNNATNTPNKVIHAIGYERNPLPQIIYNGNNINNSFDYNTFGQFTVSSEPIQGLYGFGIAFPERVKDLDGSDELAVGLWKFMKHIKKAINLLSF